VRATVVVVAGPSGSGKSRLCRRLGLPTVNLDDFYKDGDDASLPRSGTGVVDWDHPGSWDHDAAVDALEQLCREGAADVPVYDIAHDGRVGHRTVDIGDAPYFLAEGIFAQQVVADCRARGILADAVCVRNHPFVTFWRRLSRDLREHRKPPTLLVRRGVRLMRAERDVVAHAVALGCTPMTSPQAYLHIHGLAGAPASTVRSA
jgi:uridine kinase